MSIILRALKRAEEMRTGDQPATGVPVTILTREHGQRYRKVFLVVLSSALLLSVAGVSLITFKGMHSPAPGVQNQNLPGPGPAASGAAARPSGLPGAGAAPDPLPYQSPPTPSQADAENLLSLKNGAIVAIKKGRYQDAEISLRKAIAGNPDDAELHNNLGVALRQQRKLAEAIQSYEKALRLRPNYPEALNNLALVLEVGGEREKALSLYSRAVTLRPSYAEGHLNLAMLLESMGRMRDAESHYHSFLTLSNDEGLRRQVRERLNTRGK